MNWVLVPQQLVTGLLNGGILALILQGVCLKNRCSDEKISTFFYKKLRIAKGFPD